MEGERKILCWHCPHSHIHVVCVWNKGDKTTTWELQLLCGFILILLHVHFIWWMKVRRQINKWKSAVLFVTAFSVADIEVGNCLSVKVDTLRIYRRLAVHLNKFVITYSLEDNEFVFRKTTKKKQNKQMKNWKQILWFLCIPTCC